MAMVTAKTDLGLQKRSLRVPRTQPPSNPAAEAATTAEFSKYVSPTYKSSPLFMPQDSPFSLRAESKGKMPSWGTHMHEYAGIGQLTFLGLGAKERDLYVARSHRHFLSGQSLVRHDKVTPTQITPFKKSLNRACDDMVPPAALIPFEKYQRVVEQNKFVKEDKYASHQERFQVFPQRGTNTELTPYTAEAIRQLINKRYGQTTYSETYYDQRSGTKLALGPQFQFYDDGDQEEDPAQQETAAPAQNTTAAELPPEQADQAAEYTHTEENTGGDAAPSGDEAASLKTDNEEESSSKNGDTASETAISSGEGVKIESIEELREDFKSRDDDRPFWPAWPGNQANCIDPVTLKIAEKRDVLCKQDEIDVRALPVSKPLKQPDYKVLKSLHPSSNQPGTQDPSHCIASDHFAPARTNFAYSGQTVLYGSTDERALQEQEKPIQPVPGCSRFLPVPAHVDANIDRICGGARRYYDIPQAPTMENEFTRVSSARSNDRLRVRSAGPARSASIENLENTLEDLRNPSAPARDNYVRLPPLWESFPGDRVVDRLGVRFMSTAQARYHYSHPEHSNPERIPFLRDSVRCGIAKKFYNHNSRRRQYYNGHHMGSSFR